MNKLFVFNTVQTCFDQRQQVDLLHCFHDLVTNFECAGEISDGVFSIHAILDKAKMF